MSIKNYLPETDISLEQLNELYDLLMTKWPDYSKSKLEDILLFYTFSPL